MPLSQGPSSDRVTDHGEARRGVAYGLAAYFLWGFFPLFFKQLTHVPPLEVLAHRIVWSMFTLLLVVDTARGWGKVRSVLADAKALLVLCATTVLIAVNWFVFITAVDHGQVLQSSFGYFINPLVSVLLGFLFLKERLRRLQLVSLLAACLGVSILTFHQGTVPWVALILAFSFGSYGLLRKTVSADALTGLFIETMLLFPLACGYLIFLGTTGRGAFPGSTGTMIYLCMAGIITAIPLLWFSASARRLRLMTVGFMQYITPTIHFLLAVLTFGEPLSGSHLAAFVCIWCGLFLYSYDAARTMLADRAATR